MARYVAIGSVALFSVMMLVAMAYYPGGNAWQPSGTSHDFWRNFWCDLLRARAYNGQSNAVSARLAWLAMCVLAVGIAAHFTVAPSLLPGRWLARFIPVLGVVAACGLVAISSVSSDRAPVLHGVAVLTAGPLGLTAAMLTLVGLARRERPSSPALWVGACMLLVASLAMLQYLRQFAFDAPDSTWLPVSQKLASGLALLWMCVVALEAPTTPRVWEARVR